MNIRSLVEDVKIRRTIPPHPGSDYLTLYQANGRFGCVWGPFGLHTENSFYETQGPTEFMHMQNWVRANYNVDFLLPVGKVFWATEPQKTTGYRQVQDFFTGVITTEFATKEYSIKILSWFDMKNKALCGLKIFAKGKVPKIIVRPNKLVETQYEDHHKISVETKIEPGAWQARLRCGNMDSMFYVKSNAGMMKVGEELRIALKSGENNILFSLNEPIKLSAERSLSDSRKEWKRTWLASGFISLPDKKAQTIFTRSLALILSTYSEEKFGIQPPTGFSANSWPFHFPQDISYIHPALLSLNHIKTAKAIVEYYARDIKGLRSYTKRVFKKNGIMPPWEYPYGAIKTLHLPKVPNVYQHEIHNAGYVCRMAHETACYINDKKWTKKYATPLIAGIAEFYKGICRKEKDGLWHIFLKPSMGQDEGGGINQKDYLCALISAEYCFKTAVNCGLDKDGRMARILDEGLAFSTLKSKYGYLFTHANTKKKEIGNQKHPVQLNQAAYLPTREYPPVELLEAYSQRYDITKDAKKPYFYGWTLGEFLLTAVRLNDAEGVRKSLADAYKSEYLDKELVQIYETSGRHFASYYTTTNGLFLQAFIELLVSTWWGNLETGRCLPWKGRYEYKNIKTIDGRVLNGRLTSRQ